MRPKKFRPGCRPLETRAGLCSLVLKILLLPGRRKITLPTKRLPRPSDFVLHQEFRNRPRLASLGSSAHTRPDRPNFVPRHLLCCDSPATNSRPLSRSTRRPLRPRCTTAVPALFSDILTRRSRRSEWGTSTTCGRTAAFVHAAQPDNPDFGTLVDAIRSADRDGTTGGKCNRVSFEHRAWRFIIATPSIRRIQITAGGNFSQAEVGHCSLAPKA
jgi:hypothetical protein